MKHCVVEDSSFVVAVMDARDPFHRDAIFILRKLLNRKDQVKIILPPLALYEIIVSLSRKGIPHRVIEDKILGLVHFPEVIVTSVTEVSAFKHCRNLISTGVNGKMLRTADFLIASIAIDYDAQVLTFDRSFWCKARPLYRYVYVPSSLDQGTDETENFLRDLNQLV